MGDCQGGESRIIGRIHNDGGIEVDVIEIQRGVFFGENAEDDETLTEESESFSNRGFSPKESGF